jgi:photosystem II stability/assembly factor-like uncharacterized protein
MAKRVRLLVGTRKGAFVLDSDEARRDWQVRGPFCEAWPIHDLTLDADGAILAAGGSPWYGAAVWRSEDDGATWTHSSAGLTYSEGDGREAGAAGNGDGAGAAPSITTVWSIARADGLLYAGVEPAGLFRSEDGGRSWSHVSGLRDHPSRPDWQPGNGGLCLHSIVSHPTDPQRLWVGISAVGTFETGDGGTTWQPRNRGVRADFLPDPAPELGQCVHKLVMASGRPDRLYQQNHCGVYRSDDAGASWHEITPGLPSQFGFPMVSHPHDPDAVFVIPLNGDDRGRYAPDGHLAVWRTRDRGEQWERLDRGLPGPNAYLSVLREAMSADTLDEPGIYFGTSAGQLFASRDGGDSWAVIAPYLPAIWSVDAFVLDA